MTNIKKSHSGQSALEFLVTYAWAFIVIAIIIAAIAYFGILRPQKVLPDRCNFNVAFDCQTYTMKQDGTLRLRLKNGVGYTAVVPAGPPPPVTVMKEDGNVLAGCVLTQPTPPFNWGLGSTVDFVWSTCGLSAYPAGEKAKLLINLSYYDSRADATFIKLAQGELFVTVTS